MTMDEDTLVSENAVKLWEEVLAPPNQKPLTEGTYV